MYTVPRPGNNKGKNPEKKKAERILERRKAIADQKRKRNKKRKIALIAIIIISLAIFAYFLQGHRPQPSDIAGQLKTIQGFDVNVFAEGLKIEDFGLTGLELGPTMMKVINNDTLLVSVPKSGKIYALHDRDHDGIAEERQTFISGLKKPNGIEPYKDWVYIAEENQVIRVMQKDGMKVPKTKQTVIANLPTGGKHPLKTISTYRDQIYIGIGSSCNNCIEEDVRRAAVLQCEPDRDICNLYAAGLRNPAGMAWRNDTLFATEPARDWLGDGFPPDEINILQRGNDYGWPDCHARNEPDPESNRTYCEEKTVPLYEIQAHSEPKGITFYNGEMFPPEYKGDLFVAYHGSANTKTPVGYKVVRMFVEQKKTGVYLIGEEDFLSGFVTKEGDILGRPVDIVNWVDGSILVSDDKTGAIYRISYSKEDKEEKTSEQ